MSGNNLFGIWTLIIIITILICIATITDGVTYLVTLAFVIIAQQTGYSVIKRVVRDDN